MLSCNFEFMENEFVPYAIERSGGRVFRMCGRSMAKWEEIKDSDEAFKITYNAFNVSESDAPHNMPDGKVGKPEGLSGSQTERLR